MTTRIRMQAGDAELQGVLSDSEVASAFAARLPITATLSRWGEEYYGSIGGGLQVPPGAEAREVMQVGELAFWPPGTALCIFFGRTPASEGDEPRAASPVHPLGMLEGDVGILKGLGGSIQVSVEAID